MCKPRPEGVVVSRFGEGPTGTEAQRAPHVLRLRTVFLSSNTANIFPFCLLVVLTVIVCSSFKFLCSQILIQKARRSTEHQIALDPALRLSTDRECPRTRVGRYFISSSAESFSIIRKQGLLVLLGAFCKCGHYMWTVFEKGVNPCAVTERIIEFIGGLSQSQSW